jgi:hypothetical protein
VIKNAVLFTRIAEACKEPPLLGICVDQMRTLKEGIVADGSNTERVLNFTYTPIRTAIEEAINCFQEGSDNETIL